MLDTRAVFAILRARFGLPPHAARADAPFCWGEEKLNAHRLRLERQFTAITAEQRAVTRDYARRTRALQHRRDACLIELAMTDLHAQVPQRQRKLTAADPALASGAAAPPALGKKAAASAAPENAEMFGLPEHAPDTDNALPVPASQSVTVFGAASDHVPPNAPSLPDGAPAAPHAPGDEESVPDLETKHAIIEAAAPGWLDVRKPPKSVRKRFPFCEMPIARLKDLDHLDLVELVVLLPEEYDDLVRSIPHLEDHFYEWFWTEEGAVCRTALEHTIAREEVRRAVWNHLLEWYWCVLSSPPIGPREKITPQKAEKKYAVLRSECSNAFPPEQHEVWHELTMLLPKPRWAVTGNGVEVENPEADLYDMPEDASDGYTVYEDDDEVQEGDAS